MLNPPLKYLPKNALYQVLNTKVYENQRLKRTLILQHFYFASTTSSEFTFIQPIIYAYQHFAEVVFGYIFLKIFEQLTFLLMTYPSRRDFFVVWLAVFFTLQHAAAQLSKCPKMSKNIFRDYPSDLYIFLEKLPVTPR